MKNLGGVLVALHFFASNIIASFDWRTPSFQQTKTYPKSWNSHFGCNLPYPVTEDSHGKTWTICSWWIPWTWWMFHGFIYVYMYIYMHTYYTSCMAIYYHNMFIVYRSVSRYGSQHTRPTLTTVDQTSRPSFAHLRTEVKVLPVNVKPASVFPISIATPWFSACCPIFLGGGYSGKGKHHRKPIPHNIHVWYIYHYFWC